jgi:O-antigen/teichoic acid export membrane protein
LTATAQDSQDEADLKALAKGGRTNVFGFVLRLAARLPFLFIAGRLYGPEVLGRFAYAIVVVEFVAQLAMLGLRRGLAEIFSRQEKPAAHDLADAVAAGMITSAVGASILIAFPVVMFPNSQINGLDRFLPLVIFVLVFTEIALAALAYRFDVVSSVRARAIVEPWAISLFAGLFAWPVMLETFKQAHGSNAFIASFIDLAGHILAVLWPFHSLRDGLIISYLISMVAAMLVALWPLWRSYGLPWGWRPELKTLLSMIKRCAPLAAADAIEWGSRRLDVFILGLFASPAVVGIYYVAQQVASLPQKLKSSFDPILGPVITRNLQAKNYAEIARQVGQVGFWIIAAQAGIALALGIPGEAVMGLVGPEFVGGTAAMAFLLAAEVAAATAVVSESALVYMARHRNLMISLGMLALQVVLSLILIRLSDMLPIEPSYNGLVHAAAVACALMLALGAASFAKAIFLAKLLGNSINIWRWSLLPAVAAAIIVGVAATQLPEWAELAFGVPAILGVYLWIIWRWGFGPEDRVLFKK